MKLALIYPPFFAKVFNENLPTVDDEFGLFPHIGFGWIARGAEAAGWEVRLWDAAATKQSLDTVIREVQEWNADMVGFSAHASQTIRDMLHWAKEVKRRTGLPAIVGGYEAKVFPDELLGHGCFDFLCAGEGHVVLPALLRAFERGSGYEKVPQIYWLDGGRVRRSFAGPKVPFSKYPTPDRSIFPNELYYSHISQRRSFTIGMSEIGCPYPCSFCCMRQSGFDARSPEQIVDEMEECIRLGIREIDWFDPLMLHDRQRAIDIAREVKRRKLDIIWSCRSRVDSLSFHSTNKEPDEELIEALAEGGCRRIYFGVESGDDTVLKAMMKGQTTTGHLVKTLSAVREAGIMALGFFIVGAPGDTEETVKKTIDFSLKLPLSYAQYQIAIIKPHTELERRHIIEETGIDYWREYVRGTVGEHLLPTPWTELKRPDLERLARYAYFRFYGRPGYALNMLRRIESREELIRYARVGAQLALRPLRPETSLGVGRRLWRASLSLGEALLTVANPGARHPVFKEGGGVRGALALAREQFQQKSADQTLTRELATELKDKIRAEVGELPAPGPVHNRYVPVFEVDDEADGQNGKTARAPMQGPDGGAPAAAARSATPGGERKLPVITE